MRKTEGRLVVGDDRHKGALSSFPVRERSVDLKPERRRHSCWKEIFLNCGLSLEISFFF